MDLFMQGFNFNLIDFERMLIWFYDDPFLKVCALCCMLKLHRKH